jgi:hypothetical protein
MSFIQRLWSLVYGFDSKCVGLLDGPGCYFRCSNRNLLVRTKVYLVSVKVVGLKGRLTPWWLAGRLVTLVAWLRCVALNFSIACGACLMNSVSLSRIARTQGTHFDGLALHIHSCLCW